MVSASILSALNVFPLKTIEFSLNTPYKLHFPLAPACGLLLVSSGFSRNSNKQVFFLFLFSYFQFSFFFYFYTI